MLVISIANISPSTLFAGNKHLYESLPRMLTIWLELGTLVAQQEASAKKAPSVQLNTFREKLSQMNTLIGETCIETVLFLLIRTAVLTVRQSAILTDDTVIGETLGHTNS